MNIETFYKNGESFTCYTKNGKLHNEIGPAVVFHNDTSYNEYWLDGKEYTFSTWEKITKGLLNCTNSNIIEKDGLLHF